MLRLIAYTGVLLLVSTNAIAQRRAGGERKSPDTSAPLLRRTTRDFATWETRSFDLLVKKADFVLQGKVTQISPSYMSSLEEGCVVYTDVTISISRVLRSGTQLPAAAAVVPTQIVIQQWG